MQDDSKKYPPGRGPNSFATRLREFSKQGRAVPDAVPYPGDPTRWVINSQLLIELEEPVKRAGAKLSMTGLDVRDRSKRAVDVMVKRVSPCNPRLVLLEGLDKKQETHLLTGELSAIYSPEEDHPPPKIRTSSANDVQYSPEEDHPPPKINTSSGGGEIMVDYGPASFDQQLKRILAGSAAWSSFPIVAVMDTGIDFSYPNTRNLPIQHNGGHPMCGRTVEPDYVGWDFVHDQNNPYDDDDHNKHGSRIAAIIARVMNNKVRILPIKVINKEGFGTLFDIFSGFEYLLSDRLPEWPKVINASWGFYTQTENPLLTSYIRRLHTKGIWLVNAAGNRNDVRIGETVDISLEKRWPACNSSQNFNVLTITTVSGQPRTVPFDVVENFSGRFVNAGAGSGTDGRFREPLVDGDLPQVKGSSYATPYFSGFAAMVYLVPNNLVTRNNLLRAIPQDEQITVLGPKIADGLIVRVE